VADSNPPAPVALAEAITRALHDPVHYQRLRVGAWRTAHQFTLDSHLQQLEAILEVAASNYISSHAQS
jgi:hypothetical protein